MRVLVADPDSVSRRMVRRILDQQVFGELVGETPDAGYVMELADRTNPDVVVLSHEIVSADRTLVTWLIEDSGVAVIFIVGTSGGQAVWRAVSGGAAGYLLKDRLASELQLALKAAVAGGIFVSPPLVRLLIGYLQDRVGVAVEEKLASEITRSLLPREQETLYRLAAGQSTEEIAMEMSVTASTVRAYVSRMLTKLKVRSRGEAIALAFRSGFYKPRSR